MVERVEEDFARVKDIDFTAGEVVVRDGKGQKDRVTMLAATAKAPLQEDLFCIRQQHERDLAQGLGRAPLPGALARKYSQAYREWGWQWVFPAASHYVDRRCRVRQRHHG